MAGGGGSGGTAFSSGTPRNGCESLTPPPGFRLLSESASSGEAFAARAPPGMGPPLCRKISSGGALAPCCKVLFSLVL